MYFDKKRNRVLLRDGTSIVSSDEYIKRVINEKPIENVFVLPDVNSKKYEMYTGEKLSRDIEDIQLKFKKDVDENINVLLDVLEKQERFPYTDESGLKRLQKEIEFFQRTGNISFIISCKNIIEKFKKDGVVWGVGRGSSCASYLLYILEIHDVDSLKYNIPFSEFSKEEDDNE